MNVLPFPVNKFSISIFLKKSILVGIVNTKEPSKIPFWQNLFEPQENKFLFSKIKKLIKKIN
jgi:hypothetical protein